MKIDELLNYRIELLKQSTDENGFVNENLILSNVLPSMLDAKLIDSEDYQNAYLISNPQKIKINAYSVNESGERLQLFIVNEDSYDLKASRDGLMISTKSTYESQFKRCSKFLDKAIKGHLNDEIQDSSPARPLVSKVSSSEGAHQFDVVEIFLVSLTSTVSRRGESPQAHRIEFEDEEITISYNKNRVGSSYARSIERVTKDLVIKKRIIDLNFLYNVLISQGSREALTVDFKKMFKEPLTAIKAADEEYFESYLCAMPATFVARLYKEFSTRLLEKNVRSFLQFRGVNKGIRETIRKEPEKFFAFNNGLTITATDSDISSESGLFKINSLKDFQIVNGGQTTATIYFTAKDGFDIDKVKLMVKINVAKNASDQELEELISKISEYSNTQSKVSKVDLRSRNPQLIKIKTLSGSVATPSGKKWFFERAKGEFSTLVRIAGRNGKRIEKEYPKERRFSKELMAKYYSAWGNQPYLVKKGGEKIFRIFISKLNGEGDYKKPVNVNRDFYEELIAKIILFRSMEKIYGSGKKAMGQLRSAAIPYSLSVLYMITDGHKTKPSFDFLKIWLNERLESDLESYLESLLKRMNELIKQYSESDDYAEYSKKEELWNKISKSNEIQNFIVSDLTKQIIRKYGISKADLKKRKGESNSLKEVDFKNILDSISIHSKGKNFYNRVTNSLQSLHGNEEHMIGRLIKSIDKKAEIQEDLLDFEKELINRVKLESPALLDKVTSEENQLQGTLDYIISKYNSCVNEKGDIISEFKKIEAQAKNRGVSNAHIFSEIGQQFKQGNPPSVIQVYMASIYYKSKPEEKKKLESLVN